jgi:small-conductance mechanosensitive channel
MKKNKSTQFMILMSLALGSSFITACYGNSDKYADPATKRAQSSKKNVKAQDTMKKIEADLYKIKREFKKSGHRQNALEQLKDLEIRIKQLIVRLKADEKHGAIWKTHEHTLNRKLRETREYIQNHEHKNGAQSKKKCVKNN